MIFDTSKNNFLKDAPLSAKIEGKTILFLDGSVIDVFRYVETTPLDPKKDFFPKGSRVHKISNTNKKLPYDKNNTYYLEIYDSGPMGYGILKVKIVAKGKNIPKDLQARTHTLEEDNKPIIEQNRLITQSNKQNPNKTPKPLLELHRDDVSTSLVLLFDKGKQVLKGNYLVFSQHKSYMGSIDLEKWTETKEGGAATLKINKTMFSDIAWNGYKVEPKFLTANFNLKKNISRSLEKEKVLFTYFYFSKLNLGWGPDPNAKNFEPYFNYLSAIKNSNIEEGAEAADPIGYYGGIHIKFSEAQNDMPVEIQIYEGKKELKDYTEKLAKYDATAGMSSIPQYILGGYIYECGIVDIRATDHDFFSIIQGELRKGGHDVYDTGGGGNDNDITIDVPFF